MCFNFLFSLYACVSCTCTCVIMYVYMYVWMCLVLNCICACTCVCLRGLCMYINAFSSLVACSVMLIIYCAVTINCPPSFKLRRRWFIKRLLLLFFLSSTRMYRVDVLRVIFSNLLKFCINNKLIITNRDVESIDPASLLSLSVVRLMIVFVDRVLA